MTFSLKWTVVLLGILLIVWSMFIRKCLKEPMSRGITVTRSISLGIKGCQILIFETAVFGLSRLDIMCWQRRSLRYMVKQHILTMSKFSPIPIIFLIGRARMYFPSIFTPVRVDVSVESVVANCSSG